MINPSQEYQEYLGDSTSVKIEMVKNNKFDIYEKALLIMNKYENLIAGKKIKQKWSYIEKYYGMIYILNDCEKNKDILKIVLMHFSNCSNVYTLLNKYLDLI